MAAPVYQRKAKSAGAKGGIVYGDALRIEGLNDLRRSLRKVDRDLANEINRYLRIVAMEVRNKARLAAPKQTGALSKSIKHSVRAREMTLFSDSPYANAHEWGTSKSPGSLVRPRGVPIRIKRTQMVGHAVFSSRDRVEEHVLGLVDHLAGRNGWK